MKTCLLLLACLLLVGCARFPKERREIEVVMPPALNDPNPAETVSKLFASMHRGEYKEDGFPRLGWVHIPALLERAPSRATLKSFPTNPVSSRMQNDCSEGIMSLWLIEGIRQGGKYPSLNSICRGVEGDSLQPLAVGAYFRWWHKVKDDPRAGAQRDPFESTNLSWY
jgi:hypothetical protein